ncbi:MAG: hypothetical protein ACRD2W_19935 [Acidimicrobiales bacterium]
MDDVQAAIRRGLSSLHSYRAEVVMTTPYLTGDSRLTAEWTASGVVKETERTSDSERVFFYSRPEGKRVIYYVPLDGRGITSARVETGIPAGPPGTPQSHPIRPDPVELARHVLELNDARVTRDVLDGRAVWVVQRSSPGDRPDLQVFTVDEQTGLALRVDALHAGQAEYQVRVENLAVNIDGEPSFQISDGVRVSTTHHGFVRTSLEDVRRVAGFAPPLPTWVPPGFAQTELSVTPAPSRGVSATYGRGMDLLLVSISPRSGVRERLTSPGPGPQDEPTRADPVRVERVTLNGGAFAGVEAQLSVNGHLGRADLSFDSDGLRVHASGDITGEEMIRLAESLQLVR